MNQRLLFPTVLMIAFAALLAGGWMLYRSSYLQQPPMVAHKDFDTHQAIVTEQREAAAKLLADIEKSVQIRDDFAPYMTRVIELSAKVSQERMALFDLKQDFPSDPRIAGLVATQDQLGSTLGTMQDLVDVMVMLARSAKTPSLQPPPRSTQR